VHLADEAGRALPHCADPAGATVADLARTDAEVVFVVRHEATIGGRNASGKRGNAVVVE
jgi:hypothetical protein